MTDKSVLEMLRSEEVFLTNRLKEMDAAFCLDNKLHEGSKDEIRTRLRTVQALRQRLESVQVARVILK